MNDNNKDYIDLTTPPKDILRYIILDRRNNLINAIETYYNKVFLGASWPINNIKSYLFIYFEEIYSAMQNDYAKREDEFNIITGLISSKNIEDLLKAKRIIDGWLYKKGLLKFDYIEGYDRTDTNTTNKKAGF